MRQPRLAELIASRLREEILSGRLTDGDSLPRQEDLLERFQVGVPSLREAMRILETEGLVSVRRGNVGGARVHLPTAQRTAYMLSLALQSRQAGLDDTGTALAQMEAVCAGMLAVRPDRNESVVPELRAMLDDQKDVLDDIAAFNRAARVFHERLVEMCGNETMILVAGALEMIWSAHESGTYRHVPPDEEGSAEATEAAYRDHRALVRAIQDGDEARAGAVARAHLQATQAFTLSRENGHRPAVVQSELVRRGR
jgi:GntR family transcriptional repressor for pyruvate dehydrogenase complex